MGAGASLNDVLNEDGDSDHLKRYFCHECHQVTRVRPSETVTACGSCNSGFVEEIESGNAAVSRVQQQQQASRRGGEEDLNQEQSRRLANAAIMLRLLERQLQNELETITNAYQQSREAEKGKECMSPIMKKKLRKPVLDKDTWCSQPSCPICSEEFVVGNCVLQLPCSHIYHEDCAVPWLDMKKTCPICRYQLTNDIPSVADLEKNFSADELVKMLDQEKHEEGEEEASRISKSVESPPTDTDADADEGLDEDKKTATEKRIEAEEGVEIKNKTRLANEIIAVMERRREASEREEGLLSGARMRALRERQNQVRPNGYRTIEERIANPSPSNRTLREVIEEGERERVRQNAERRERMRALGIIARESASDSTPSGERDVVSNGAMGLGGTMPGIRGPQVAVPGGPQRDDFSRAMAALLSSNRSGMAGLGDSEDEEEETAARVSLLHARSALASAREDSARLNGSDLTPYGAARMGGSGMPTTFVIRSNGEGMQIERRQALQEAVDSLD